MGIYHGDFHGKDDLIHDFEIPPSALDGVEVLFAAYESGGYEGDAFALFRKDGKLFEVRGSHCSCYGLEGQWEPEETTVAALKTRDAGYGAEHTYRADLAGVLATL